MAVDQPISLLFLDIISVGWVNMGTAWECMACLIGWTYILYVYTAVRVCVCAPDENAYIHDDQLLRSC